MRVTYILGPYQETSILAHCIRVGSLIPVFTALHPPLDGISTAIAEYRGPLDHSHLVVTLQIGTDLTQWPFADRATVITITPPTNPTT